jgi:hypothetical protein
MNNSNTFKQEQMLSAYVDERCTPREKQRVESALKTDAGLRLTLSEFYRCRKMLRAIPQMRAPRNFTLSPSMVPQKPQRFFLAPVLNYGALVAAAMFVFLFAGTRLFPLATAKYAAPEAMLMSAPAADSASEATVIPLIIWGGAVGKGGGGGGVEGSGIGGGPAAQPMMETSPGDVTTEMVPDASAPATNAGDTDATGMILGLPDESIQGQVIIYGGEPETASLREFKPFPWALVGEISLAALAVGLAITAWLLRKHR